MTPVDPNDGAGVRELATLCGVIAKLRAQVDLLTAERDDARRQRDECAAALATIGHQAEVQQILDATAPATNDDARAILHAMASESPLEAAVTAHTEHVAVTIERQGDELALRADGQCMYATTDEAVALITALLADGAVHSAWLHGRGGR